MPELSLGISSYSVGFVDDRTAKTDIYFIRKKSYLFPALKYYMERSDKTAGFKIINVCLDGAGENMVESVKSLALMNGIQLETSPPNAPQSNRVAERFMKELGVRARVLLHDARFDNSLWAEPMNHSNWLRNRLPSDRIIGNIPVLLWNSRTRVNFKSLPIFGQRGFAFLYQSATRPSKKLFARAAHGNFVGLESDQTLYRICIPANRSIILIRAQDFKLCSRNQLPGVSSLNDKISRQNNLDHTHGSNGGHLEDLLTQAFSVYRLPLRRVLFHAGASRKRNQNSLLPRSFHEAVKDPLWCEAIDREYIALRNRQTWDFVPRDAPMHVLPFTWVFRLKPMDMFGIKFLHRARCFIRGGMQMPGIDFDPESLYAPVAFKEAIRMLFAISAASDLIVEGGDVSSAYLYGDIDTTVYMEQPTNSSGKPEFTGFVCHLRKSIYVLRQAGLIWGSFFEINILSWGFKKSGIDARVYFKVVGNEFIILVIIVDDMTFASNSQNLIDHFKQRMSEVFDVKFFGCLKSFLGWEFHQTNDGIKVTQLRYVEQLLEKHGLLQANGT